MKSACNHFKDCLPLLVTGITGVAGYNAFHYFHSRFPGQVIGIRPRQTWQMVGEGIVALDAEEWGELPRLFEQYRFRAVLNAVGNCALKSCELDPRMADLLNVVSARAIADCARRYGARLVHLSSDLVFSGTLGCPLVESDRTDPVTVYGKTMVQGEAIILRETPEAAILRISLPMGPSFSGHAGAIDWIQSRFKKQRPATLYFDEVRSCTYTDDLNHVFERVLTSSLQGLYHCGGPRSLTLYQIAQVVNRIGGYDPSLLHGCPRHAAGPLPPRAGDVTMNSERLYDALGGNPFRPWPVGDEFPPTDAWWHYRRDEGQEGSAWHLEQRLYRYPAEAA